MKYFILTIIIFLTILILRISCNGIKPIAFKLDEIKNDTIYFSSEENIVKIGEDKKAVRITLICPLSNNSFSFAGGRIEGKDDVTLESDFIRDYSLSQRPYSIVKYYNNRYHYQAVLSIFKQNEKYEESRSLKYQTLINLIRKKGDCIDCKVAVMFYFLPLTYRSKTFHISSDSLIKNIRANDYK